MNKILNLLFVGVFLASTALALENSAPKQTTPVYSVAGQGVSGVENGKSVTVQGVVTASFLEECGLDGFFIQGTQPAPDDLPSGLFIYTPDLKKHTKKAIQKGRLLQIKGKRGVFHGRPQLEQVTSISIRGTGETRSVQVEMPLSRPKRLEGVKVRFEHQFTVTDNYDLRKYGSLELAKGGRAFKPTNLPPGEGPPNPGRKHKRIILDDGCYSRNPVPIPYLNKNNTLRVGTTVQKGLTGILTRSFDAWRIHPTKDPRLKNTNPRPGPLTQPDKSCLRIAVINTHSYFLTLGDRGAKNKNQLKTQQDKLLTAIKNMHPDILVLLEMENREEVPKNFIANLKEATADPWGLVQTKNLPDNNLRISLAYRKDRVRQTIPGNRDFAPVHDRPPLVAGFKPSGKNTPFAVAAAHFKSKGDCPKNGDVDSGQGCWNKRRKKQAKRLVEFIRKWRQNHAETPVLVAGDLNAYGTEDPVKIIKNSGKKDLLAKHIHWRNRYTYIFSGESGYLDHLLASPELAQKTCRVFAYSINADEPRFLEYNKSAPKHDYLNTSPYRSSDHDPVAVDLQLR